MVNDTAVAAEDIYIGDGGSNSLLVSSVDVKKPDQIVDNTMILSQYVDIYVSESAFYLYQRKEYWDDVVPEKLKVLRREKKSMRRVIWGIWLILLLIAIQIRSLQWICRMTKIPRYSVN